MGDVHEDSLSSKLQGQNNWIWHYSNTHKHRMPSIIKQKEGEGGLRSPMFFFPTFISALVQEKPDLLALFCLQPGNSLSRKHLQSGVLLSEFLLNKI